MATAEFADFLYGACLLDWDAERERMQRYADRFDAAERGADRRRGNRPARCRSPGRSMKVDAGGANIPGGEFFGCPVEDSAEGTIAFAEFPAVLRGPRDHGHPPPLRGRAGRRRLRRHERGVPARDARHRRGRAPPRRARHRLQPRDHAVHAEHALRREDRRHGPPRARQRDARPRRHERLRASTGTSSRTSGCRATRIELDGELVQQDGALARSDDEQLAAPPAAGRRAARGRGRLHDRARR